MNDGTRTWTYAYNTAGALQTVTLPDGSAWQLALGTIGSLTYPDGATIAYAPNALGEPTQVGSYATGISHHANGTVASYTLGNGIQHTLKQNLRGLPLVNRDAGVLQDQYSYDRNGNVIGIADQQQGLFNRSMAYDGLDRLVSASAPGAWGSAVFAYDVLGNLRTSTVGSRSSVHSYGANNLLANIQTNGAFTGYAYDARGNVTGRGTQGFYFDLGNRMLLAHGVASYSYDGHGRRVGVSGSNGLVKTNVYDQGGRLLFSSARQNTSVWTTRFVYLGGKLIAETDANGVTTYSHTDALGSPVARTNAAGQLLSRTRYEPYGLTVAGTTNPGANGLTALGFTGHVNDPDTGLVYMQQRYYDPLAARFMSVDPIVTDATTGNGFNRYEYGNNNPYLFVDPDGRASTCSAGMGGCTVYVPSESGTGSGTGVSGGTSTPGRSAAVTTGTVVGGVVGGGVGAACTAGSGGLCAAGTPGLVGGGMIIGGLIGGAAYDLVDLISSVMSSSEGGDQGQDNAHESRRRFDKGQRDRAVDASRDEDGAPRCSYCGQRLTDQAGQGNSTEIDHVKAHSRGGKTTDDNSAASCRTCNRSKGAKELGTEWVPPLNR